MKQKEYLPQSWGTNCDFWIIHFMSVLGVWEIDTKMELDVLRGILREMPVGDKGEKEQE